jgi:hypothetical protein
LTQPIRQPGSPPARIAAGSGRGQRPHTNFRRRPLTARGADADYVACLGKVAGLREAPGSSGAADLEWNGFTGRFPLSGGVGLAGCRAAVG